MGLGEYLLALADRSASGITGAGPANRQEEKS